MTKWLKPLSKVAFHNQSLPSYFRENRLDCFLTDFFLLAIIIIAMRTLRGVTLSRSQKLLVGFASFCLLSIFFSTCSKEIWPYFRWLQLVLPIAASVMIGKTVSTKEGITICFWILFWSASLQCFVAIGQYFMQHSIGLKYLGEAKIRMGEAAQLLVPSKTRWFFDRLLHHQTNSVALIRPSGTFPHPNILGGFLGMTLFASAYLFASEKLSKRKAFIAGGIALQVFSLFLTFSRGALFGLIGGALFLLILLTLHSYKKIALQLFLVILASGVLSTALLHEQLAHRGGVFTYNKLVKESDNARLYFQNLALSIAKQRPLLGAGYGQFLLEVEPKNETGHVQKVHNIYLLILSETGILGLLAFGGFCLTLLFTAWKRGIDLRRAVLLTIFVYFLWIGCVDHYLITTQHGAIMFFFMAGLLSSYGDEHREKRSLQIQAS